ncbi:FAD-dependent oxidoreductase [Kaarinaea lacus]
MANDNGRVDKSVAVLGAGITGLTAAYFLQRQGRSPVVIERDVQVGGLAKTIEHKGFKFDLGGHRFLTSNADLEQFVKNLLNNRYLIVNRTSNIYLNRRYVKYPLQPFDAFRKVGYKQSLIFLYDYLVQKYKADNSTPRSLEEWVVQRFGKSLYEVFFKGYSEKVWGMDCTNIDADWIAQRIQNLSLAKAVKSAIIKRTKKQFATLTDKFLYPAEGIGSITDNLRNGINANNLQLEASVERISHDNNRITSIEYRHQGQRYRIAPEQVVSTIPLSVLAKCLDPAPPSHVLTAANSLRSRDLVLVTLMVNRDQVSKDSWVYFPDKNIPFGRIHEPRNWSEHMAPKGKTAVVTEHFCFRGDETWSLADEQLVQRTVDSMVKLGLMNKGDLLDGVVMRIANAYPLFETGYREQCETVCDYLSQFENLNLAGRTGAFRYYNMDQAMLSGVEAVEQLTGEKIALARSGLTKQNVKDHAKLFNGEENEMCPDYSGVAT